MSIVARDIAAQTSDGHRYTLIARIPDSPLRSLLWLPAMGVAAKHYLPFADALAARGIATFLHEWRGIGSSSLRAGHAHDWGYRELLLQDIQTSASLLGDILPDTPRIIGGHSLGGQLACCTLALSPAAADTLWLVASGAPYWRAFPLPHRAWLPLVYRFAPWLAKRNGFLPGRRLHFGGNEARGVITDWARSGLSGRYAAANLDVDLESAMAGVSVDARCIVLDRDWLGPASSARFLLSKLRASRTEITSLGRTALGTCADHFAWMQFPDAVVERLIAASDARPQSSA